MRALYYSLGWLCLILGIIGAFLPIMPTTPFVIVASFCFAKCSPRMHKWLTSIPIFGDAIIQWERHRAIPVRGKVLAIIMIWASIGSSIIFGNMHIYLKIMLFVVAFFVSNFIVSQNSYPKE